MAYTTEGATTMTIRKVRAVVTLSLLLEFSLILSATAQNVPSASATNAIGTLVIVRTDGVQQRLQGKGNVPLYEGDVLKTDGSSQALIEFQEGIQAALNEDTSV